MKNRSTYVSISVLILLFQVNIVSCDKDLDYYEKPKSRFSFVEMKSLISGVQSDSRCDLSSTPYTIPDGLLKELEKENEDPLVGWLRAKRNELEAKCMSTEDCFEKARAFNMLLYVEKQLDAIGADDVWTLHSLCDGFYGYDNVYVEVKPEDFQLDIGESKQLTGRIIVGNSTCEGELIWGSLDPDIATVDQSGLVKGIGEGTARIAVLPKCLPHITTTFEVVVGRESFDVVFVVETGYAASTLAGFDYGLSQSDDFKGFKNLGQEITSAAQRYLGDYRIGIVGFEHYPVWPTGLSFGECYPDWAYKVYDPQIEASAYRQWLPLTGEEEDIRTAVSNLRIMCSAKCCEFGWQAAHLSALIGTIDNFAWTNNSNKVIVLIGLTPATFNAVTRQSDGHEGHSRYVISDAIEKAKTKGIRIFTINGYLGFSNGHSDRILVEQEYLMLSRETGGKYYSGQTQLLDLQKAIDETIQAISIK